MQQTEKRFKHIISLFISVLVVVPGAIVYGFYSRLILKVSPDTITEYNILKAIMGVYLGFSAVWILGILRRNYLKIALITNVIFMLGIAFGRMLSILIDGLPGKIFVFGTFAELFLGLYSLWIYKIINNKRPS